MSDGLNEGVVGDTTKLMAHRLIARKLRCDPTLVERAKIAHARQADQFAGWSFVREWQDLLALLPRELASRLISRDREMVRLRNTSPCFLAENIGFGDYDVKVLLHPSTEVCEQHRPLWSWRRRPCDNADILEMLK